MAQTCLRLAVGIMVVVVGSLLQGCALMDAASQWAKSFVETSCRSGAKSRLHIPEEEWVGKINDKCKVAFEDSDDDAEEACLDHATAVFEEGDAAVLDNLTEMCVASFFNVSDKENHSDTRDHITQFFESMSIDADLNERVEGHLNQIIDHIKQEHRNQTGNHQGGNDAGNHTGNHAANHAENHAGSEDAEDKEHTDKPKDETLLFDADISIGHIGRPGGVMVAACFAGMILIVSGFVVVRRRDARHVHTEESQGALTVDGEQASMSC